MEVYIAYGWPEGPWHGKKLRCELKDQGYQITTDLQEADIIIAHSAGCYMLPDLLKTKLIVLIDIPNWPHKPLPRCTLEKIKLEEKDQYWFRKTLFHIMYGIGQPRRLYKVYQSFRKKHVPIVPGATIISVRNEMDTYMEHAANQRMADKRKWIYKNLAGQHDDLWQNPKPYIEIIKQNS